MKTIGLLGGMSWESTVTYYKMVNSGVKEVLGGLHSARCILYSVDFQEIETCQKNGEWERSGEILLDAAQRLQKAGADFIVICTNTMHKVVPQMNAGLNIPILHIAEVTADALLAQGVRQVALLGTRYTMEQDFYKSVLIRRGIKVLIPSAPEREVIDDVIFHQLCLGEIRGESKAKFLAVIERLAAEGARGVILGCTEIGLLVNQEDTKVPLYDTTAIHAAAAVREALKA
ncbi:MAG: aspartate/glutamate racemase family protein [Clostridia bacterium]|nr:aspartate/glutamate racemase family protein [Clostridia bacterium]